MSGRVCGGRHIWGGFAWGGSWEREPSLPTGAEACRTRRSMSLDDTAGGLCAEAGGDGAAMTPRRGGGGLGRRGGKGVESRRPAISAGLLAVVIFVGTLFFAGA